MIIGNKPKVLDAIAKLFKYVDSAVISSQKSAALNTTKESLVIRLADAILPLLSDFF